MKFHSQIKKLPAEQRVNLQEASDLLSKVSELTQLGMLAYSGLRIHRRFGHGQL